MKADELAELEAAQQLRVREEYPAAFQLFRFAVHVDSVEPRTYLANDVKVNVMEAGHSAYFEVTLTDAWAWNPERPVRTLGKVLVHTFDTVTIEDREQP
jgi:hypothetical protein